MVAARTDDEHHGDRFGRRDDFLHSRRKFQLFYCNRCIRPPHTSWTADRQLGPPREDIPVPTQPPYTAFVGNLAFDLTENELEQFFSGIKVSECSFLFDERLYESMQVKSVKIIKSKDEKPKGFGYIEFEDVDGLKDALLKTGSVNPPFLILASYWRFLEEFFWTNYSSKRCWTP